MPEPLFVIAFRRCIAAMFLSLILSGATVAANLYSGDDGAPVTQQDLLAAIADADIVILGEVHVDAVGHAWQQNFLAELFAGGGQWTLSLEEFDRSQQGDLDQFAAGELSGEQLKAVRSFVGPGVKNHWLEWSLPKLNSANDADVPLLASNAPLKYSRMARNAGCNNLDSLPEAERALFDCPLAPADPAYQLRFYRTLERVSRNNQHRGMKPLQQEQMAKMFRAHRVWDATMAQSLARARQQSDHPIVHIVGSFHTDYNGGLIQEIKVRDPDARILVIGIRPQRATALPASDLGRADILVYRGDD